MIDDTLPLDGPFSLGRGREAGLTLDQLRSSRWRKDFAGVRSLELALTPVDLARAYAAKMPDDAFFSHTTAALLHGLALPRALEDRMEAHVSVPPPRRAPRDRRIKGHQLIERPGLVRTKDGLRVASVRETICQLATLLGLEDLIVAAESAMMKNHRDAISLQSLADAVAAGDRPRQRELERMLPELRPGVRSPKETVLRRFLTANGIPEPEINADLFDADGRWIAERDLVWRRQRVIVEYDGRPHFTDEQQRLDDLAKDRRLMALGWIIIRVSKDDLARRRQEILAQVRWALSRA